MKETQNKSVLARILTSAAVTSLSSAANGRCAYVYHQPKQPETVKRYRKF